MLERHLPLKPGPCYEDYGPGWSHDTAAVRIGLADIHRFLALCSAEMTSQNLLRSGHARDRLIAPESMLLQVAERMVSESGVTHGRMLYLMQISARFRHPVQAGDTLVNHIRFQSKRSALEADRGVVVTEHRVITGQGEIAIEYEAARMIRCRGPIGSAMEPIA